MIKKMCGKICIFVMAMSPMAAADVFLSFDGNGDGTIVINYVTTDTDVVGIAFNVTTSAALTAVSTTTDLPVHIDAINSAVAPVLNPDGTLVGSTGIADPSGPGEVSATTGAPFSISLATLDGVLPASGTLVTFAGPSDLIICLSHDALRSADGAVDKVTGSVTVHLPPFCFESIDPCPNSCWTLPYQCQGDADGDGDVDLDDFTIFKNAYLGISVTECSDFDKDGSTDLDDFTIFKNSYLGITPLTGGCTYMDCVLML